MGRRVDGLALDARKVANRLNRMVRSDGVLGTARYLGGHVVEHLDYPRMRRRRAHAHFRFEDVELPYAYYLYNQTWRNERSVEVAVAEHFLARRAPGRMLEAGNVLGNYGRRGHDVVDKYEPIAGLINADLVDFHPDRPYDTIVTLSTLEHVRFDEEVQDAHGPAYALETLREALASGGEMLVTVPTGYNPGLDDDLHSGRFALGRQTCYRRLNREGDWVEVSLEEALATPYGAPFEAANAIVVGTERRD